MTIYKIADILFLVFHSTLIMIILFGWIWKPARKLNLIIILLTAASWSLLGIFFGFGFCPLTEWHFSILRKLGEINLPSSYIKYLADRITGYDFSQVLVDRVTLLGLVTALICSVYMNFRPRLHR
jgi:hypothetical protein